MTSPRSIALPEQPSDSLIEALIEGIWGTYRPGEAEMGIRREAALRGYQAMMRAVNGRSEG